MAKQELDRRYMPDLGAKLGHLEGLLGAYLPTRAFDRPTQHDAIGCDRSIFSKMTTGKRQVANWELGRLAEHFRLTDHGLDYRVFLDEFEDFDAALKAAAVGSYGGTTSARLRDMLRKRIDPTDRIRINRDYDRDLNVGGIGKTEDQSGLVELKQGAHVTLTIPLLEKTERAPYLFLLHDFPGGHAASCLMPSQFAPNPKVSGQWVRLPQAQSNQGTFPVGGTPGYRCLYAIQSSHNFASRIGLHGAENGVMDIDDSQVALLVGILENQRETPEEPIKIVFAEYTLA